MAAATTTRPLSTKKAQEQVLASVKDGQKTVVDAFDAWAKVVDKAIPAVPALTTPKNLPTAKQLVEETFDFTSKLLEAQRQFTVSILATVTPVIEKKTKPAEKSA
jgi:hypothetical protein